MPLNRPPDHRKAAGYSGHSDGWRAKNRLSECGFIARGHGGISSCCRKARALAQADAAYGKLPADKQLAIRDTMGEIVDDLADHPDEPPEPKEGQTARRRKRSRMSSRCNRMNNRKRTASAVVASGEEAWPASQDTALRRCGLGKSLRIDARDAPLVCLSYFGAVRNPAHVRFLIRRLKRMMPNAKFLAGYWMLGENPEKGEDGKDAVGAHFVATSLADAVALCVREASGATTRVHKIAAPVA